MPGRLSDYQGDGEQKKLAEMMIESVADLMKGEEEHARKLARMKTALNLAVLDTIETWLDCYPSRREARAGREFDLSIELEERLVWIFAIAQAINDQEHRLPTRWSFARARKAAIDKFKLFGGKL